MASANSYKNLRDLAGAGDGQALRSALASLPPRAKKDFLGKPVCPSGRLLLHQAAEEGREEVVEILVEAGADVSAKDNRESLLLMAAAGLQPHAPAGDDELLSAPTPQVWAEAATSARRARVAEPRGATERSQFHEVLPSLTVVLAQINLVSERDREMHDRPGRAGVWHRHSCRGLHDSYDDMLRYGNLGHFWGFLKTFRSVSFRSPREA
ncbi:hypothetical protein C7M84_006657 [Penaeus vannamei]|uniref:Uncharacterized protein n=1 Tax=Penaeus vannamei TaxID=6689 RepID=A0A3R7M779_PENVA|nr:hypothetical protein C7M84_006657 [Penaeus vannamei]